MVYKMDHVWSLRVHLPNKCVIFEEYGHPMIFVAPHTEFSMFRFMKSAAPLFQVKQHSQTLCRGLQNLKTTSGTDSPLHERLRSLHRMALRSETDPQRLHERFRSPVRVSLNLHLKLSWLTKGTPLQNWLPAAQGWERSVRTGDLNRS